VREQFGEIEQLFVTPGPDQCLWVFDQANLEALSAKLDEAPAADSDVRIFRRSGRVYRPRAMPPILP
jgi:DNA-binding transcriptional regulator/RsmH inhibitor MraZ